MRALVISLCILLVSPQAYACDFTLGRGIKKTGAVYVYSAECHVAVGNLVRDNKSLKKEVVDLRKTIELKDLALNFEKERADRWMDTAFKVEKEFGKSISFSGFENKLHFVAGVGLTVLAVWGAGQLR